MVFQSGIRVRLLRASPIRRGFLRTRLLLAAPKPWETASLAARPTFPASGRSRARAPAGVRAASCPTGLRIATGACAARAQGSTRRAGPGDWHPPQALAAQPRALAAQRRALAVQTRALPQAAAGRCRHAWRYSLFFTPAALGGGGGGGFARGGRPFTSRAAPGRSAWPRESGVSSASR